MADRLQRYRSRRADAPTPEPTGSERPGAQPGAPRFVVHEHHARRLHWDLRLEHGGALLCWAVPKGIPRDPAGDHLAVRTEDHPLDYVNFEGEIPRGSYGAGEMTIWDSGTYEAHKVRDDELIVTLYGARVRGRYALFRTRGDDWMIHRMDPPDDPGYEPPPRELEPMLASPGELSRAPEDYGYEVKWDGVRALVAVEGGTVRATARSGRSITVRYPELRGLGPALGTLEVLLDGEIVVLDEHGSPDFGALQRRMHVGGESAVRRAARAAPATYVIFDLLHLDGRSTLTLPYARRRELLEALELEGEGWRTPAYHRGDGAAFLAASRERGLEGVVAKRLDSRYEPGRRSGAWVKIKHRRRASLVVGAWVPGGGAQRGRIGALAVGFHDGGELRYAGSVGSGLGEADAERLARLLEPLRRDASPFGGRQPPRDSVFVAPRLIADVDYAEWTRTRTLRAPSFKGLRDDVDPAAIDWDAVRG